MEGRGSPGSISTSRTTPTRRRSPSRPRSAGDPYPAKWRRRMRRSRRCSSRSSTPAARSDTLVVLTSDHGESLGEHGEATHGIFAYEATLRVPLIVLLPAAAVPAARRRGRGGATSTSCRRSSTRSRLPAVDGLARPQPDRRLDRAAERDAAVTSTSRRCRDRSIAAGRRCSGVIGEGHEVHRSADPGALRSPRAIRAKRATWRASRAAGGRRALRALLADRSAAATSPVRTKRPRCGERLRALGYVSVGILAGAGEAGLYRRRRPQASHRHRAPAAGDRRAVPAGRLRGALSRARALVAERPTMRFALLQLAHLEREAGDAASRRSRRCGSRSRPIRATRNRQRCSAHT